MLMIMYMLQWICVVREYAHSLEQTTNTHILKNFQGICLSPGFVKQLLHVFTELKTANICNGVFLKQALLKLMQFCVEI